MSTITSTAYHYERLFETAFAPPAGEVEAIELPPEGDARTAAERLLDEGVPFAGPLRMLDPKRGGLRGPDPEFEELAALVGGARDVRVGVVDSTVDFGHEVLEDNRHVNAGEIPENGIDDDANGFVDDVSGWSFAWNPLRRCPSPTAPRSRAAPPSGRRT